MAGHVRIDPRIRERRVEVLRTAGQRRLRRLLAVGAVLLVAAAVVGFLRSPLAEVRGVEVIGARHTSERTVLLTTGLDRHPLMVSVDSRSLERRLQALPWVAWATVARHWPSTVEVRLGERRALAQTPLRGGGWALLDGTGRVLARQPAKRADLTAVVGVGAVGAPGSSVTRSAGDALQVVSALPTTLAAHVSAVVESVGSVELSLAGGATAVIGPPTGLGEKFEALLTVLDEVNLTGVRTIDVRVPSVPALTRG